MLIYKYAMETFKRNFSSREASDYLNKITVEKIRRIDELKLQIETCQKELNTLLYAEEMLRHINSVFKNNTKQ